MVDIDHLKDVFVKSSLLLSLPTLALVLSACGPAKLELPAEPVARAATCGVVAAAGARQGGTGAVDEALPSDFQGRVLHYALLAAVQDGRYSQDAAAAVAQQMPVLQPEVTKGQWQELAASCDTAFPKAAKIEPVELPADSLKTQVGCYQLGSFLWTALQSQSDDYAKDLGKYRELRVTMDPKIGAGFARDGIRSDEAIKSFRKKAMAEMIELGSPIPVMNACTDRYLSNDAA